VLGGLKEKLIVWRGRKSVDASRKENPNMWRWLDGNKRIIMLVLFMAAAIVKATGHGDYDGQLGIALRVLDWDPASMGVPLATIGGLAGGLVAIGHAVVKNRQAKADAADTVTPPR